jgi:N-acetyl-alpha-D-glucosaminyl L-malate synthase BshA
VIEIFTQIRRKLPARLVMIGDGPDRGTAEWLAKKNSVASDVIFLGKQETVTDKLGVADLFLLPSDQESFGLAALEAMACEVPVIATNVGGVPDVVTDGVDGYLVEPRDVAGAAGRALEILSDEERRREMGRLARKNAQAKYCSTKIIPQYEEYYGKVLETA